MGGLLRSLVRPGRPRRRSRDALDVGFRLSIAMFMDCLWAFLVVFTGTSDIRGAAWFWWAVAFGVPLLAVNVYAALTAVAFVDDRAAVRAQRGRKDTPPRL
jgi:hypothetical protein